jgi:uncharacterized protein YecE (DUF72 family)
MLLLSAVDFNSLEINNTFFRIPEAATFIQWRDRVPRPTFTYTVKVNRVSVTVTEHPVWLCWD